MGRRTKHHIRIARVGAQPPGDRKTPHRAAREEAAEHEEKRPAAGRNADRIPIMSWGRRGFAPTVHSTGVNSMDLRFITANPGMETGFTLRG